MNDQHRKLQLLQLEILKDVHRICSQNNLRYYLVGGTLLGAVRHKGFIPWDDDVDIAMYRDDYNKLSRIIQNEYGDKYFMQDCFTDKYYSRFLPKIRLRGTLQIEKVVENIKSNHGIYIDIFPLDKVSKNKGIGLTMRGAIIRVLYAYKTIRLNTKKDMPKWKLIIKKMLKGFTFLIPDSFVNHVFDYVCTFNRNKNCKYTTSFLSRYGWRKQLFKNSVYGIGVELDFEGYKFLVPKGYKRILRSLYNDYLKLPPVEKRYIGHQLTKIEFGEYESLLNEIIKNEK